MPFGIVTLNLDFFQLVNDFFQFPSNEKTEFALDKFGEELCPYAGCVFVALLCLFKRTNINFCPLKFILKCGAKTCQTSLSCTRILDDIIEFIDVKCSPVVEKGKHDKEYKKVVETLISSNRKAGLLWYSTGEYNHCVTVYVTSSGTEMEVEDNQYYQKYITDLPNVRQFKLLVLSPDNMEEPRIVEEWKGDCDANKCKEEFEQLSKTDNSLSHGESNLGV